MAMFLKVSFSSRWSPSRSIPSATKTTTRPDWTLRKRWTTSGEARRTPKWNLLRTGAATAMPSRPPRTTRPRSQPRPSSLFRSRQTESMPLGFQSSDEITTRICCSYMFSIIHENSFPTEIKLIMASKVLYFLFGVFPKYIYRTVLLAKCMCIIAELCNKRFAVDLKQEMHFEQNFFT